MPHEFKITMDIIIVWCGASFLPLSFPLFYVSTFSVHSDHRDIDAPSPQKLAKTFHRDYLHETFSNFPLVPDSRSRPECACAIGQRGSVRFIFSLCLLDGHAQGPLVPSIYNISMVGARQKLHSLQCCIFQINFRQNMISRCLQFFISETTWSIASKFFQM